MSVIDEWRPYFEYAAPFATVGSAIFSGLSYISERDQEKRLGEISYKIDLVRNDIRNLQTTIVQRMESIQLRNITAGVYSIVELLNEYATTESDTLLGNILSESSRLKHVIYITLDDEAIDPKLKSAYSSLLMTLAPLRITALAASGRDMDKIFNLVEEESLEFELRRHQLIESLVDIDRSIIYVGGALVGRVEMSMRGPGITFGNVIHIPLGSSLVWSYDIKNDYTPKFLNPASTPEASSVWMGSITGPEDTHSGKLTDMDLTASAVRNMGASDIMDIMEWRTDDYDYDEVTWDAPETNYWFRKGYCRDMRKTFRAVEFTMRKTAYASQTGARYEYINPVIV
jgi:hypothetical protein